MVITQPGARNRDTPRSSHAHQPAFDVTGGPASASATTSPSSAPASSWTDVHCAEDGDVSVPVARAYPPPPPPFSTLPCPLSIHLLARFVQREPLSLSLYIYMCVCRCASFGSVCSGLWRGILVNDSGANTARGNIKNVPWDSVGLEEVWRQKRCWHPPPPTMPCNT